MDADLQWRWESPLRNYGAICHALGMLQDDEVTDLSLRCSDWRSILVHRVVGMLFSDFLRTRLQNSQAVVLDVPVQYEDLEVIVNYFYRGTVLVELHNVERLLAAAVALEIDGLRDATFDDGTVLVNERLLHGAHDDPPQARRANDVEVEQQASAATSGSSEAGSESDTPPPSKQKKLDGLQSTATSASQPPGNDKESEQEPPNGDAGPMDPAVVALQLREEAHVLDVAATGEFANEVEQQQQQQEGEDEEVNEVEQQQQQQEGEDEEESHQCLNCHKVFGSYEKLRRHQRRITCRHYFFNN